MARSATNGVSLSDKGFDFGVSRRVNLQRARAAGFTHLHFSYAWTRPESLSEAEIAACREDLEATGMQVLDVHGCHPKRRNLWSLDADGREAARELLIHRLEVTHQLGGDAMVYHVPAGGEATPEVVEHYLEGLARVEPEARSRGIVLALENHYQAENDRRALSEAYERFKPDYLGFTLDPGHGLLSGNLSWLLSHCMDRLTILHLNDNNGSEDRHWLPFDPEGLAPWDELVEAVARSPYLKPLQLEVSWDAEKHPTHELFLEEAYQSALNLTRQVEHRRKSVAEA